ncbi:thrombospondin-2-like [Ylistrum balloti]|uniref:thrombospondin-2-like n=1 Tax=Ylistrum balloti TaxID=509963 RepID=UPI002905F1E2|nr:thrombospondin-2-like [Ylistrum balloti]
MNLRLVGVTLLLINFTLGIQGKDTPKQARKSGRIWGKWLRCNVSCGKGWQSRVCLKTHAECNGHMTERRICNMKPCPEPDEGKWSQWQPYSHCQRVSETDECMGIQQSIRTCNSPSPQPGGKYCTGCASRVKPCSLC